MFPSSNIEPGWDIPGDIISHKMFLEIHAFFVTFGALQEIYYFLTGNSFLQQEVCTIDRKATSFEMKD